MKRTFIAIKIPFTKKVSELYQYAKNELKDEKIKWVEENKLHITVLFLGDIIETDIEKIRNELSVSLKRLNSFLLKLNGTGVFRSVYKPKALWIGTEESDNIKELYKVVVTAIATIGFEIQIKIFKPHITFGRTKHIKDKHKLKKLLEYFKEQEVDQIKVSEVYFYESILSSKGSHYKVIEKFNLNMSSS